MFILRTQWALLAILLNKLIATLNQVDFFLLKRVDYYYREQQIIIHGPNLKTRPSFKQEANKRHPLLLWAAEERPGVRELKAKQSRRLGAGTAPGKQRWFVAWFTLGDFA